MLHKLSDILGVSGSPKASPLLVTPILIQHGQGFVWELGKKLMLLEEPHIFHLRLVEPFSDSV
jgi:hypothetical protein